MDYLIMMHKCLAQSRRGLLRQMLVSAGLAWFGTLPALAQTYPANPASLVVPYPAGGPSDVSARILAGPISKALGAQVVVENIGGATGTIGASRVLNAPANGAMFFQGTQNELILPPLTNPAIRYKPDDFESLQPITVTPLVLLVRSDLPVSTTAEFLALAKQQAADKSLTYGSVGVGSLYHLITERMARVAGVTLTHVPYRGTSPVVQDLIGKQIDFSVMPFQASMKAMAENGQFKIIAVLSKSKPAILSHLPSISETAPLQDFDYASYAGYFVKKGTPPAIRQQLNTAINQALRDPDVIARLEADGRSVPGALTLDQAQDAYAQEVRKYVDIIKDTGFQPS